MGLETYFVITKENTESSTLDSIELIEGGANLLVTDENKKMFIDLWYSVFYAVSKQFANKK